MEKIVLIDGNNLLFRSYYATAYSGSLMKNSKGFPTNALFGFINMINKIITEENPKYIMVAFDKGKNFRHEKYTNYKAGRIETPKDLLMQFPYAYKILDAMGITHISIDNYEADDIIGTFSKLIDNSINYNSTIISSDKDLLQLISDKNHVKLLKQKNYILMDEKEFINTYGITPIKMIDLKALMGDASDNIPGVKGIGEKTALNLLKEYGSLENIYNNIDSIKGKTKEKLLNDKDNAFFSYDLATIYKDIPLSISFNDILYKGTNNKELLNIYNDLEFYSLSKKLSQTTPKEESHSIIKVNSKIEIKNNFSYYLELSRENYHLATYIALVLYDGTNYYYFDKDSLLLNKEILLKPNLVTYDLKKNKVFLKKYNIEVNNLTADTMLISYLLNQNTKDDISYLANSKGYNIMFYTSLIKNDSLQVSEQTLINNLCQKAKFLYDTKEYYLNELEKSTMSKLYNEIELPLIDVLSKMEINGITVSIDELDIIKKDLINKLDKITNNIYSISGEIFNIQSPIQLGNILFNKLEIPYKDKKTTKYKTDHDTLIKYIDDYPIIKEILEYKNLSKLLNTYLEGLKKYILPDNKIHTIFKQTATRTGRLSSIEPNLQNIPIRTEEGKRIRKAFLPEENSYILTSDYSQIELRVLASISNATPLIDAFNNDIDIHSKVASDIYNKPINEVTKEQRRTAKAVIFGIVYGISGYGLGENLSLSPKEAKEFIDKYLTMYKGVDTYMKDIVSFAKENGYVKTLYGRIRYIDELKNTNYIIRKSGERIALNTPIQGTSADIIKIAMINMDKEITKRNLKSKMLIQVHDELVFSVPKEELDIMKDLVKNVMESATILKVPLKVEIESGLDWYNAK